MNAQEVVLYEAAKNELERIYEDVHSVRDEFKELIAQMAAQMLAEERAV